MQSIWKDIKIEIPEFFLRYTVYSAVCYQSAIKAKILAYLDLFFNCSGVLDAVFVQLNIRLQFLLDSIAFYSHFSQDGLRL